MRILKRGRGRADRNGHHGDRDAVMAAARDATADIGVITDAEQNITYMSALFKAMTGYEDADLLGRNCRILQGPGTDTGTTQRIKDLLASEQVFDGEILNYRKDGSAYWTALKIIPLRVGSGSMVTHYVSIQRDVTNKVAALKQLEVQALNDHVTGLPNRAAAERAVDEAVRRAPHYDWTIAVGLIDLDDFRQVNNTLGHAAGDLVLQQWASRVLSRVRDGDVLARMGGDEFLLILENISWATAHEDLNDILGRLHEAVEEPFTISGHQISIGMSMGIALVPEDGTDSTSILRGADEALYSAKERRNHGSSWWESAEHARSEAAATEQANDPDNSTGSTRPETYRAALRSGGTVLHFQPIIDLRDGTITLFEALARLGLPEGHLAYPDDFLPHFNAEDLRVLFEEVLDQALRFIAGWDRPGVRPDVTVNLPPEILHNSTLPAVVAELLQKHRVEPDGLVLELLESQLITLEGQRTALQSLADLGVRLAMDDLGSGYSSLQRLATFPFSAIKLDRGLFLHAYDRPLETLSIMATLLQMGRDLQMYVVVEGLEDESLTEAATILGAPFGQGYYFAEPTPAEDCGEWSETFEPHLHRSPILTPLGALAYHWQFIRLAAPHPLTLENCPLTRFIHDHFIHDTDTSKSGAAQTDVISWHALQHASQVVHPASSQLFINWLTQLISASPRHVHRPEARITPSQHS